MSVTDAASVVQTGHVKQLSSLIPEKTMSVPAPENDQTELSSPKPEKTTSEPAPENDQTELSSPKPEKATSEPAPENDHPESTSTTPAAVPRWVACFGAVGVVLVLLAVVGVYLSAEPVVAPVFAPAASSAPVAAQWVDKDAAGSRLVANVGAKLRNVAPRDALGLVAVAVTGAALSNGAAGALAATGAKFLSGAVGTVGKGLARFKAPVASRPGPLALASAKVPRVVTSRNILEFVALTTAGAAFTSVGGALAGALGHAPLVVGPLARVSVVKGVGAKVAAATAPFLMKVTAVAAPFAAATAPIGAKVAAVTAVVGAKLTVVSAPLIAKVTAVTTGPLAMVGAKTAAVAAWPPVARALATASAVTPAQGATVAVAGAAGAAYTQKQIFVTFASRCFWLSGRFLAQMRGLWFMR